MNEGEVKQFEDMTREELIATAKYWRSEYERMTREYWQAQSTISQSPCPACGIHHDSAWQCMPLLGGGVSLKRG